MNVKRNTQIYIRLMSLEQ